MKKIEIEKIQNGFINTLFIDNQVSNKLVFKTLKELSDSFSLAKENEKVINTQNDFDFLIIEQIVNGFILKNKENTYYFEKIEQLASFLLTYK